MALIDPRQVEQGIKLRHLHPGIGLLLGFPDGTAAEVPDVEPSPATDLPTAEYLSAEDEQAPAAAAAPSKGSGTGLGFMIGGGVAFVGGLLMGGTRG